MSNTRKKIKENQSQKIIKSPFIVKGEFKLNTKLENKDYLLSNFTMMKDSNFNNYSIGKGAFGEIFLIKQKSNGKLYALKQINKKKVIENGASLEIIKREISIHIRITHPYIVKLYSTSEDDKNYNMIMDYIPNGTLFSLIQKLHGLKENDAFKYFIQVVSAIQFLHYNGLAHRDIKPENILLDDNKNVKLCDFGWCVDISKGERMTFCGTYEYMAPEIVNEQYYDYGIDIWSLGVLLYEMIHGFSPFRAHNNTKDAMKELFNNITHIKLEFHKDISKECKDLIEKLLSDKSKRIKINDIFEHPWVKKYEKEYFPDLYKEEEEKKKVDWGKEFEIDDEKDNININLNNLNKNKNNEKNIKIIQKKTKQNLPFSDDSDEDIKKNEKNEKKEKNKILKKNENEFYQEVKPIIFDYNREKKQHVKRNKINYENDDDVTISTGILDEKIDPELENIFRNASMKKNKKKNNKNENNKENKNKEKDYFSNPNENNKKILYETQKELKDLHEGDEFNFLKDLNNKRGFIKRQNDPSKMLNMNFLPKDLLYNETNYKDSTQSILRTIDLIEKSQRIQEEKKQKNIKKKEEPPKESFIDSILNVFKCGQCKGN